MEELAEHLPFGPANIAMYASMDRVDRYMTESHREPDSVYISRV